MRCVSTRNDEVPLSILKCVRSMLNRDKLLIWSVPNNQQYLGPVVDHLSFKVSGFMLK